MFEKQPWHDYKPGDVTTKLHRLFRHSEEVDNMSVRIGEVATFPGVRADKAQIVKIAEEEHEIFSAWERLQQAKRAHKYAHTPYEEIEYAKRLLVDECADCITAICNLLAALSVDDMRGAMTECEQRNRERGRL